MSPWIIIVILGGCAIVYALIQPKKNKNEVPEQKIVQEMEATLEHYMAEIESDNDSLIQRVAEMKGEAAAADQRMQAQLDELEKRLKGLEETRVEAVKEVSVRNTISEVRDGETKETGAGESDTVFQHSLAAAEQPKMDDIAEPQRETIKARYAELFRLHGEGKSMDAIAKHTGIQRGEVQLILQLAEREES